MACGLLLLAGSGWDGDEDGLQAAPTRDLGRRGEANIERIRRVALLEGHQTKQDGGGGAMELGRTPFHSWEGERERTTVREREREKQEERTGMRSVLVMAAGGGVAGGRGLQGQRGSGVRAPPPILRLVGSKEGGGWWGEIERNGCGWIWRLARDWGRAEKEEETRWLAATAGQGRIPRK